MKPIAIFLLTICTGFSALAQSLPPIDNIKLKTADECRKADTLALQTADFILATPTEDKNVSRLKAESFLIDWMGGTADYTFTLDDQVIKNFQKNTDLMGVYMAALTASALENKSIKDAKLYTPIAVKKFLAYITNTSNGVELTGKLKKMIEAQQKSASQ